MEVLGVFMLGIIVGFGIAVLAMGTNNFDSEEDKNEL